MVFIQQTTDRFIGWGTPWHGSSPYCMNTNVPIKAVIVLQQDSRNQIRRLHGFEKVTALSRNIIFPQWLPDGTQKCLDILNPFVQYIPVYELSCRPDEDAIQMTEDVIIFLISATYHLKLWSLAALLPAISITLSDTRRKILFLSLSASFTGAAQHKTATIPPKTPHSVL